MLKPSCKISELQLKAYETLRVQGRLRGGSTGQHIIQMAS